MRIYLEISNELFGDVAAHGLAAVEGVFLGDGAVERGGLPRRRHLDVQRRLVALARHVRQLEQLADGLRAVDRGVWYAAEKHRLM